MSKQPTRRRRAACRAAARALAIATAIAALVATLGAGQALATTAPPDERLLERQGRIDNHETAGQADEQAKAEEPGQGSPAQTPRRYFKPEPPVAYGPPLDSNEPLFPAPAPPPPPPASDRTGLVISLAVAALLLALGAATTWRLRRRHTRPQPTT